MVMRQSLRVVFSAASANRASIAGVGSWRTSSSLSVGGNRGFAAILLTDTAAQLCAACFDRPGYPAPRCTFRPAFTVLFDGVDLTGGALSIVNGATLSLVFNLPGSTVDWDDAFWGTNRAWTIIDVAGGSWDSSLFSTLLVGVDSTTASLASKRAGSSFQIVDLGGDLVLEYVVVPEPGSLALAGIGLAAAAYAHRRRRRRLV
jgi:hypothetical protein